jgi:serine/threonine protein kinase
MSMEAMVELVPSSERVTAVGPADSSAGVDDGPEAFGRFLVLRTLGSGAMGTVFCAYDQALDRKVAIKVARGDARGDAERRRRLLREAQALARVSHPNVVRLYERGECAQGTFLVMELLPGTTLRAWIGAARRSWREVLDAFLAAGRGLSAVHAQRLIHRDFKPDNVVVGPDGQVRLVDFGLACAGRRDGAGDLFDPLAATLRETGLDLKITAAGAILGTPAYMSPEQYKGVEVDARSDQFSFCAALYEGLYGQRPFAGETAVALEEEVLRGAIQPPPPGAAVPAWVHRAIVRGLQREPGDRWPSMSELLAALSRAPMRRRPWWFTSIAVGVGLAVALLATRSVAGPTEGAAPVCAARAANL